MNDAPGNVPITETQLYNDGHVLGVLHGLSSSYDFNVTNVSAGTSVSGMQSEISSQTGGSGLLGQYEIVDNVADVVASANSLTVSNASGIQVNDTAANVASHLNALQTVYGYMSAHSYPFAVTLSDPTDTLSVTETQLTSDANVIGAITNSSFNVGVTNVLAADATGIASKLSTDNTHAALVSIAVSDTSSNVEGNISELSGLSNLSITLTDSSPGMAFTEAQFNGGLTAIGEITNASFFLGVNHVVVADLSTVETDIANLPDHAAITYVISIDDTAANISGAFDTLNSDSHLQTIIISDNNPLTLTAAQALNDTNALSLLGNANTSPVVVDVTDTAANISANFGGLNTDAANLGKITVSDSASNEVTVTAAAALADTTAEAKLYQANGSTAANIEVSDVYANIDVTATLDALSANTSVNKIVVSDHGGGNGIVVQAEVAANDAHALNEIYDNGAVSTAAVVVQDTGANIASYFGGLNAAFSTEYISNMVVVTSGTVTISASQAVTDTTILHDLYQPNDSTHVLAVVSDIAANITAHIDGIQAQSSHISKIVVTDSASNEVSVSVNSFENDGTALAYLYNANGTTLANYTVDDTAGNIQGALDSLNGNSQINHIIVSDNGTLTISAEEAVNDSTAISLLENANVSAVNLVVSDSAANITEYLNTLNSETNISSIVIADNNPLTLTASQVGSDTYALSLLSNANSSGVEINVVDTAAGISANLDALQANDDIVSITVSNNAPITVSVATLGNDAVVLSELTNANSQPVVLTVLDTATNIAASLLDLNQNSQVTSVVISNNAALTLTVAQLTSDTHVLGELSNANATPYTLNITDNAAHISTALNALNGNSHIATITDTNDGAIVVAVAQITSDATALSKLVNADSSAYTLAVSDTGADIASGFSTLNGDSHVASITVSDSNPITLTETVYNANPTAVGELTGSYTIHVTSVLAADAAGIASGNSHTVVYVSDSAANVAAHFDALNGIGNTQLGSINLSDATPVLTITETQLDNDTVALAAITNGSYSIDVAAATAANAVADSGAAHVASVAIVDNSSNVDAQLNSLEGIAGKISSITLTDSGTPTLAVTYTQFVSDATVLGEITSAYSLRVTNATVSELSAITGNSHVGAGDIIVVDNAANVQAGLAPLEALGTKLDYISLTDGGTPTFTISEATYNADGAVLKTYVESNYNLTLTSVAAADATALSTADSSSYLQTLKLDISDTASNVAKNFDALNALDAKLGAITMTDGSPLLTITEAQLLNDTTALGAITNSNYSIDVASATVANIGTDLGTSHVASVAIVDTASNVNAGLNTLESDSANISSITLTDQTTPTLSVTYTQFVNDATALGEIGSAYNLNVHFVPVADVSTVAANSHVGTGAIVVRDTAIDVQSGWRHSNPLSPRSVPFTSATAARPRSVSTKQPIMPMERCWPIKLSAITI